VSKVAQIVIFTINVKIKMVCPFKQSPLLVITSKLI